MIALEVNVSKETVGKIKNYRDLVGLSSEQLEKLCSDAFVFGLEMIISDNENNDTVSESSVLDEPREEPEITVDEATNTSNMSDEVLSINLTKESLKIINALKVLNDGNINAIHEAINGVVEKVAKEEIQKHIGITPQNKETTNNRYDDNLGDPEPESEDNLESDDVMTIGGITEQELDNDMLVNDPSTEFKAEAPEIDPGIPAEEAFSSIMSGNARPVKLHDDHEFSMQKPQKKKQQTRRPSLSAERKKRFLQSNLRAKITAFNADGVTSDKF